MNKDISILVIGASGQLGRSIKSMCKKYPEFSFIFTDRSQLDLSNTESINNFFKGKIFDVIINCAAYTSVDKAETDCKNAEQINYLAVKQLAKIIFDHNSKLVHISSDYVFNGENSKPYKETDIPKPDSVYGKTKLQGEICIQNILDKNAIIIRTSWLYAEYGRNFVKTMLELGDKKDNLNIIYDQIGTPTYARDLAEAIMVIIKSNNFKLNSFPTNIINFSNEGVCSWYDFAKSIFELANIDCNVIPIETKDYPTLATRPHYSVLNKSKIKNNYGLNIPHWKDGLKRCLNALKENQQ